jgi:hypothetical protein
MNFAYTLFLLAYTQMAYEIDKHTQIKNTDMQEVNLLQAQHGHTK